MCGKAQALIAATLPHVINIKIDDALADASRQALAFWSQRLGLIFASVGSLGDCMIYVHRTVPETIPLAMRSRTHFLTIGAVYSLGTRQYDGVAYIIAPRASVIAHEIGHLLGFGHAARGIMQANAPRDWIVSAGEVNLAHANRLRVLLQKGLNAANGAEPQPLASISY